ncbi:MAG: Na+/H+ antiporter NhaA [Bacteroidales bacterium]|nr:Na+/H+ antiporter NhaA [Bacteroidales bacterium]
MPLQKLIINPIKELEESGKLTGVLLVAATIISLSFSNSNLGPSYLQVWDHEIGFSFLHKSILHWINDGLMPLFFLLVGIEIKREFTKGELSQIRQAVMPIGAAIGGILVPAIVFVLVNLQQPHHLAGWAIPTATDIAFSLGVLTLLGNRIPFSLKVFLVALAIIDDLGAIIIIAAFYTNELNLAMLLWTGIVFGILVILSRFRVKFSLIYFVGGAFLWFFILKSGIHPTIAGVLVALIIPRELAEEMEHALTKPISYIVLPLFALANTAIPLSFSTGDGLFNMLSLGIILGLLIGKPLGIAGATMALKWLKLGSLPEGVSFRHLLGLGFIAGIGFTMSIFISSLSFDNESFVNLSKLAVIIGSVLAGVAGMIILRCCPITPTDTTE